MFDIHLRDEIVSGFVSDRVVSGYLNDRYDPDKGGQFGLFVRWSFRMYALDRIRERRDTPAWATDPDHLNELPDTRFEPYSALAGEEAILIVWDAIDRLSKELIDTGLNRAWDVFRHTYLSAQRADVPALAAKHDVDPRRIYNDLKLARRKLRVILRGNAEALNVFLSNNRENTDPKVSKRASDP